MRGDERVGDKREMTKGGGQEESKVKKITRRHETKKGK